MESKSPDKSSCSTAVLQTLASTAMKQLHLEEEELGKVSDCLNELNYHIYSTQDRDDDLANQCDFPTVQ